MWHAHRFIASRCSARRAPNQLWNWDITKLRGPAKWTYFYLYVILDVFSRYFVGWMVAPREGAELARKLIEETCKSRSFCRTSSPSTPTAARRCAASQWRFCWPHHEISPRVPESLWLDSRRPRFLPNVFAWYNEDHRHSGIGMMAPAVVHYGLAPAARQNRQLVLDAAYAAHPDRFVHRPPVPLPLPKEVWINKPQNSDENIL